MSFNKRRVLIWRTLPSSILLILISSAFFYWLNIIYTAKIYRETDFLIGFIFWSIIGSIYSSFRKKLKGRIVSITSIIFTVIFLRLVQIQQLGGFFGPIPMLLFSSVFISYFLSFSGKGSYLRIFKTPNKMLKISKKIHKKKESLILERPKTEPRWLLGQHQGIIVQGFKDNLDLLSKLIFAISVDGNLVFFCHSQPYTGNLLVREKTIKFAKIQAIPHKIFYKKYGNIGKLFTGETEKMESIALECRDFSVLLFILENYWFGDKQCLFISDRKNFNEMVEKFYVILNEKEINDNSIIGSSIFMRDYSIDELEIVTDKISINDIQERISTIWPVKHIHQE